MANFLVNAGRAILTNRLKNGASQPEPVFLAWGTGAGAASASSTALSTEARSNATSGGDVVRVTGTSSRVTGPTSGVANAGYQVTGTITSEASRTITNVGIFDTNGAQTSPGPPSGGNLFVIADGLSYALGNGDALIPTFTVDFT